MTEEELQAKKTAEPYERLCKVADTVLRTPAGRELLELLEWFCEYHSQSFQAEDGYNPIPAALRDGARGLIIETRTAAAAGAAGRRDNLKK